MKMSQCDSGYELITFTFFIILLFVKLQVRETEHIKSSER